MKNQPEFQLQKMIAQYLRTAYRDVLFLSDVRASVKLTIPQQVRSKAVQADDFACPDMVIFEPHAEYIGMFLELKAATPYKLDGYLKKDDHLVRQQRDIGVLRMKGYHADFYWDFNIAKAVLDWYLKGRRQHKNHSRWMMRQNG